MKSFVINRHMQDIFGEEQSAFELIAILLFGLGVSAAMVVHFGVALGAPASWRGLIALALIFDIGAGCIANFTRSTNDFYAERPRNRRVFIVVHVHILLVALLLGRDFGAAVAIWGYTIVAALIVNGLQRHRIQRFVGGLLLATGVVWISLWPALSSVMLVTGLLFLLKVAFSFAVNHASGGAVMCRGDTGASVPAS
ncbi:MAG: hypothetical protein U0S50_13415 [Sphingopyxis sp.]|uniref:hypothetical protein n=1 Tax=Sphingopyxis sp. TaxID=1908224 RepID=UPI002AB9D15D|nr:hypothetical protein [Sphingopyxis sp.]MDZ3832793.1 hypothetical protein [Sphingopyxis sp.]